MWLCAAMALALCMCAHATLVITGAITPSLEGEYDVAQEFFDYSEKLTVSVTGPLALHTGSVPLSNSIVLVSDKYPNMDYLYDHVIHAQRSGAVAVLFSTADDGAPVFRTSAITSHPRSLPQIPRPHHVHSTARHDQGYHRAVLQSRLRPL